MKASVAMRLGAMLGLQFRYDLFGPGDSSCAVGAIYKAHGLHSSEDIVKLKAERAAEGPWYIYNLYPWMNRPEYCPVCKDRDVVPNVITCLNDEHKWSRENIADWLATIEPVEEPVVETKEKEPACDTCLAAQ